MSIAIAFFSLFQLLNALIRGMHSWYPSLPQFPARARGGGDDARGEV